jgi:hypothetical protein
VDNIRGAVTMAYPMGLPEWDPVRLLLEDAACKADGFLAECAGEERRWQDGLWQLYDLAQPTLASFPTGVSGQTTTQIKLKRNHSLPTFTK